MSNEAWLKKFMNWNPEQKIDKDMKKKIKCDNFLISDNGYCKHYMGCKTLQSSCIRECDLVNDNK